MAAAIVLAVLARAGALSPRSSMLVFDSAVVLLSIGAALSWTRALVARDRSEPRLHLLFALGGTIAVTAASASFLASHWAGAPIPAWLSPLTLSESLFWVAALLAWPAAPRPAENRGFVALDVAILAITTGLLFWYFQLRPSSGPAASVLQQQIETITWALVLIGVSVAVLRGSRREYQAAHRLLAAFVAVSFFGNFGFALLKFDPEFLGLVITVLIVVTGCLRIMSGEAYRMRWPWGRKVAAPSSGSLAPTLAVIAMGLLVLVLGLRELETGLGPVIIGGVAVTLLVLTRQVLTMRQNARLLAEQAAHETDARIAALVRHTSDVIVVTDDKFRIKFASPSAESLWADRALDLFGTDIRDLVETLERDDATRHLVDSLSRPGQSTVVRWRMPGSDGESRRVEAVITSLLHEPSVNGVVLTLRDQTERAELEEQLQQAQKMEAVGQLAGGIAHDFNNLLTTVLGHSELGMESLEEPHPVREDFRQIKRAAQLAASLTNQLLAFSRKQVIEPKVVDVHDSLRQVTGLIRRLIEERVHTEVRVAPDVGHVRMDPSQMEQVVLNLAINARDAMPEGGTLTVAARRERVGVGLSGPIPVHTGEYVVVDVADTGTGMDAATQARIFEPFFTTKPPGRGTGLGLASVYGIIKQNGGGLRLRSAVGKGTMFSVYLPLVEREAEAQAAAAPAVQPAPDGATILLVEDEPWMREIAERVLNREGYRVLSAGDAVEARALAATASHPIDLLLTDVVMPGLSGPRLAAQMRQSQPGLRVLYISGYGGGEAGRELEPEERLLQKPFTPMVLVEHVKMALERAAPSRLVPPERAD